MKRLIVPLSVVLVLLLGSGIALAAGSYEGVSVQVISQPRPEWDVINKYLGEFEAETGIDVTIKYFAEAERRSKERLDAATRIGGYQVYYLDETNVAEFAAAGWIVPLLPYYPAEYEFDDFMSAWRKIATYEGEVYFAPTFGCGDLFMYRKDLVAQAGLLAPETLDDYLQMTMKLHQPPAVYGTVTRGTRATNWWRWGTFFYAFGGQYLVDGEPAFNSEAAVKATNFYMDMLAYGPPGGSTASWGDCIETFRAGKAGSFIDADVFYDWCEDPEKSHIVGKVAYTAPPAGPAGAYSAGCAHGLGLSAVGCPDERTREASALFIAWATSKENELARLDNGVTNSYARTSTLYSGQMQEIIPEFLVEALEERAAVTGVTYMRRPEWPEIAENLGIILEELFTGTRTDVQGALDEAVSIAEDILSRRQ